MRSLILFLTATVATSALVFACGSSDDTSSTTATTSTTTTASGNGGAGTGGNGGAGGTLVTPPGSCRMPGDMGNELGVGKYCTPNGGECPTDGGLPLLCIADVAPTEGQWFCIALECSSDAQCGTNATCATEQGNKVCLPNDCLALATGTSGAGGAGGAGTGGAGGAGGSGGQ